jgi:hypothetical protein
LANTSIKVNGKPPAVSDRSTNKLTTATVLLYTYQFSKALPSLTRSLSSTIIIKIKAGNNNITKGHSFLLDTNLHHNPSKGKSTISSTFKNAVHNTSDAEVNIVTVTVLCPDGKIQTIRAYRESHALREFIRTSRMHR